MVNPLKAPFGVSSARFSKRALSRKSRNTLFSEAWRKEAPEE
jgi:hypothetical protein